MARTTIRRRLTLLFGATMVLVVALTGIMVDRQLKTEMFDQARRTGIAIAGSISAASSNDFFTYNYVALEQKAEESSRDPEVSYVILYDKEGSVAAFSGQGKPDRESAIPPLPAVNGEAPSVIVTEGLVTEDPGRGFDILMPVTMSGSGERWGTVRLGLRLDRIYRRIEHTRLALTLLGFLGALLGWFLAALFTKRITVPLNDLVAATVKVSDGDYEVDLNVTTGDEVQDLAENFQRMVTRIREQRETLEDNLREINDLKHFSDLVILSITDGLMTLNHEGQIQTFNRKAEEILSRSSGELLGRTTGEVWGTDSGIVRFVRSGLSGDRTVEARELKLTINDEERTLEITTAPIVETGGPSMGLLVLFDDLTEKKTLEDRVRRADRLAAMGTLAAGLAHEIKNPLTAVRAFVQMFPERYERADFRDKFNRIVPKELQRVNGLLEDLLDLVRKPKLRILPIELPGVVDHVLETLDPEVEKRGITVSMAGREEANTVLADESYLIRAIHNVVLNAIQAMPGGGKLDIEFRSGFLPGHNSAMEIHVSDTGPGIPADQVDDIFNPFFTSKEMGTGLGLAVTNKVIEDQGGSVRVSSERAEGTEFIIALPSPESSQVH